MAGWTTHDNNKTCWDGVLCATRGFEGIEKTISLTIESPTDAEDFMIGRIRSDVTVEKVIATVRGSNTPSVTINIKHDSDRSAAGTSLLDAATAITNTTTGQDVTLSSNPKITKDDILWLESTAQSGTVDELNVTIYFK